MREKRGMEEIGWGGGRGREESGRGDGTGGCRGGREGRRWKDLG